MIPVMKQSPRLLIFAISSPKSEFWMLGDAFEVRKAASRVGFTGERQDDGPSSGRRPVMQTAGDGALPCESHATGCFLDLKTIPEHPKS